MALTGWGWAREHTHGPLGPRHSGDPGQGRSPHSSHRHYSWPGELSRCLSRSLQTRRPVGKMAKFSTPGIATAALTPKPSLISRPSYLGGGQLQVTHRVRLWEELDLLHQVGVAVPTHHCLVQGPGGCERERAGLNSLYPQVPHSLQLHWSPLLWEGLFCGQSETEPHT